MIKKRISITVDVEEWFHTRWFNPRAVISRYYNGVAPWGAFIRPLNAILHLFEQYKITSTFLSTSIFALSCFASPPSLLSMIVKGRTLAKVVMAGEWASSVALASPAATIASMNLAGATLLSTRAASKFGRSSLLSAYV